MTADPEEVLTRAAPGPDFTVRYGSHPEQIVDVRLPPVDPTGPLVVFIHGGFWRTAYDRVHTGPLAADLASRGYPVASIEYRRVGQDGGGWPGTFDDVAAAVERVAGLVSARTATEPVPPVLAGHSAGGHLALWYVRRQAYPRQPLGAVRGVLALAPVADLVLSHRLGLGDGAVAALLGGGPDDVPDRYALADPATTRPAETRPAETRPAGTRPAAVPAIIVHGVDDGVVPVEVSRSYVDKAGGDTGLVELPGVDHFALIDPLSAAWPAVVAALRAIAT